MNIFDTQTVNLERAGKMNKEGLDEADHVETKNISNM